MGKPIMRLSGDVAVVYDGNSLMNAIHPYITSTSPVSGSGASTQSVAIAGQTWADMKTNSADVVAALQVARPFAMLLLWEHTNQLNSGTSVAECCNRIKEYLATVRAARPDVRIVIVESIPREGANSAYHTTESLNIALQQVDQWVWSNRRMLDIEYCTVRVPGSPFALTGFTTADFDAAGAYWASNELTPTRTHLSPLGYQTVALEVRRALARVKYYAG